MMKSMQLRKMFLWQGLERMARIKQR